MHHSERVIPARRGRSWPTVKRVDGRHMEVYTPYIHLQERHIPGYTPLYTPSGRHIPGYTPERYTLGIPSLYTPERYTLWYTPPYTHLRGTPCGIYASSHLRGTPCGIYASLHARRYTPWYICLPTMPGGVPGVVYVPPCHARRGTMRRIVLSSHAREGTMRRVVLFPPW